MLAESARSTSHPIAIADVDAATSGLANGPETGDVPLQRRDDRPIDAGCVNIPPLRWDVHLARPQVLPLR